MDHYFLFFTVLHSAQLFKLTTWTTNHLYADDTHIYFSLATRDTNCSLYLLTFRLCDNEPFQFKNVCSLVIYLCLFKECVNVFQILYSRYDGSTTQFRPACILRVKDHVSCCSAIVALRGHPEHWGNSNPVEQQSLFIATNPRHHFEHNAVVPIVHHL